MIKFFRKIRQQLLSQNRFSKYLLYAIGEIVLVMIGILLALQVNNWNNNKQKLKKERAYLIEIRENLVSDTVQLNEALEFNIEKRAAIDSSFIELASSNTPFNRMYALGARLTVLGSYRFFLPNDLGFSNMVASDNIELIRNDSIRRELSVYYKYDYKGTTQKRMVDVTRSFVDYSDPLMATKERYKRFRDIDLDLPSYMDIDIYKDPKIYSFLDLMHITMLHQDGLLHFKKREVISLIQAIDTELTKE